MTIVYINLPRVTRIYFVKYNAYIPSSFFYEIAFRPKITEPRGEVICDVVRKINVLRRLSTREEFSEIII